MYVIKKYEEKYEKSVIDLVSNIMMQEYEINWEEKIFIDELKEDLKIADGNKNNFLIATDEEDNLLGTIAIREDEGNIGHLKRMYVAKECRGNGLAQNLFDNLIDMAQKNKYENIYLGTYENLKPAIKFYTKNGFETYEENDGKVYMCLNLV